MELEPGRLDAFLACGEQHLQPHPHQRPPRTPWLVVLCVPLKKYCSTAVCAAASLNVTSRPALAAQ
jgi:hypothetical protein